jgi:hypothetical protein
LIEEEIKRLNALFEKKKNILIPTKEKSDKNNQPAINENNYQQVANYASVIFERPKHNLLFSAKNRLEGDTKEYEASIYDFAFLKNFNYFTVEELEIIIVTLENDVKFGEIIPFERAELLLKPLFPSKEQYFETVYKVSIVKY